MATGKIIYGLPKKPWIIPLKQVYLDANNSTPAVITFPKLTKRYLAYSAHINNMSVDGLWLIVTQGSNYAPRIVTIYQNNRATITSAASTSGDDSGTVTITKSQTAYIFNGGIFQLPW